MPDIGGGRTALGVRAVVVGAGHQDRRGRAAGPPRRFKAGREAASYCRARSRGAAGDRSAARLRPRLTHEVLDRHHRAENTSDGIRRPRRATRPAPAEEYVLVCAIEQGDEAWVEVYAGIATGPPRLITQVARNGRSGRQGLSADDRADLCRGGRHAQYGALRARAGAVQHGASGPAARAGRSPGRGGAPGRGARHPDEQLDRRAKAMQDAASKDLASADAQMSKARLLRPTRPEQDDPNIATALAAGEPPAPHGSSDRLAALKAR